MGGPDQSRRWSEAIADRHLVERSPAGPVRVGVLFGEGSGPEVIRAALTVLSALGARGVEIAATEGPPSGPVSPHARLPNATADFCRDTFAAGGAVLAGPHAGRWVYDVRQRFDLFCKISPVRPAAELEMTGATISPARLHGVDLLIVREQSAGVYQGSWGESVSRDGGRVAEHSFSYTEREVRRILAIAATLARWRRGRLAIVVKHGGIPSISGLWCDCADEAVEDDVAVEFLDIDYAVYKLVHAPLDLDVIVAPNLFGDLLSDAAGALLGSRGITFGANFDAARAAIYQTNHGAAHDLAGRDRANPAGQILAAAMMLRESFGLAAEADLIERALTRAWHDGFRTEDIAESGTKVIGTREMGERVAERVDALAARATISPERR